MESIAIATAAAADTKGTIGAAAAQKMLKANHEATQQLVAMIDQAAANSAALADSQRVGSATAPGVGNRLDKQV